MLQLNHKLFIGHLMEYFCHTSSPQSKIYKNDLIPTENVTKEGKFLWLVNFNWTVNVCGKFTWSLTVVRGCRRRHPTCWWWLPWRHVRRGRLPACQLVVHCQTLLPWWIHCTQYKIQQGSWEPTFSSFIWDSFTLFHQRFFSPSLILFLK